MFALGYWATFMLLSSTCGGLPFLRPFLRQGEQGKRSGLRCFVLPDSQQYSISALPQRECYEASLFPDLLDIRTLLGRILPHEIVWYLQSPIRGRTI